jgi:hypothetical protein
MRLGGPRCYIGGQIVQSFDDCNGGRGQRGSSCACRRWRTTAAFLSVGWSCTPEGSLGSVDVSSHGSTAVAVLAAAEALSLAASVEGALLLGDDFGDGPDAATTEDLAAMLRAHTAHVWLTTRRPA